MAASSNQVLLLAVIAAVAWLASPASATQWVVGDQCGWRSNFNETCWADGKTFVVGDTLQFVYPKGEHTVVQVGEADFATCNLEGNQLGSWCSGNDVVTLNMPGKMWFICTKPNHCLNGMKLAIDVVGLTVAPAPAPPPFPVYRPLEESAPAPDSASSAAAPPAPAPASSAAAPLAPAPASSQAAATPAPAPAPASPAAAPPATSPAPTSPGVAPLTPARAPSSAAVSNPVGGAVAAAAAAVVAAALAF